MTERRSLALQRQCVEHAVSSLDDGSDHTVIDGLKQAALTIGWLERHGELLKMWDALRRDNPELFTVMHRIATEFPGAKIHSIREAAE
jgi:hypothetical protein